MIISAKEYAEYVRQRDTSLTQLQKIRTKFLYKQQSFDLETITNLKDNPTFLRCETEQENIDLPPYLKIIKEVTHDDEFSSYYLARGQE